MSHCSYRFELPKKKCKIFLKVAVSRIWSNWIAASHVNYHWSSAKVQPYQDGFANVALCMYSWSETSHIRTMVNVLLKDFRLKVVRPFLKNGLKQVQDIFLHCISLCQIWLTKPNNTHLTWSFGSWSEWPLGPSFCISPGTILIP